MLEGEMDSHLGYQKHEDAKKEMANRRNGHSSKTVRSDYGEVSLEIPRDRESEFEPVIVKKGQRNVTGIEDQVIALYAKGVSTRNIQAVCCIIKMDKVANKNTHFCKGNIPRIAKAIESKIKPRYPIR